MTQANKNKQKINKLNIKKEDNKMMMMIIKKVIIPKNKREDKKIKKMIKTKIKIRKVEDKTKVVKRAKNHLQTRMMTIKIMIKTKNNQINIKDKIFI
jgi:hypothetical protein